MFETVYANPRYPQKIPKKSEKVVEYQRLFFVFCDVFLDKLGIFWGYLGSSFVSRLFHE